MRGAISYDKIKKLRHETTKQGKQITENSEVISYDKN